MTQRRSTPPLHPLEQDFLQNELISRENANIAPSAGSIIDRITERLALQHFAMSLLEDAVPGASRLHGSDIYIHKMPWCVLRIYCGAIQATLIPRSGLKTSNTVSKPPRHLDACVDQLSRVAIALSFEREGAVGLNEVDAALAPYVRVDARELTVKLAETLFEKLGPRLNGLAEDVKHCIAGFEDWLTEKMLRQQVQRLFFTLNNIERPSIQSPFTNVSFAFTYSDRTLSKIDIYYAGQKVGTAADFLDEMIQVAKAFCSLYLEGDATGAPFTFPIPTVIVNGGRLWKVLESDPELWRLFWMTTAVRGSFYFMNSTDDTVLAFCCRLQCSIEKIRSRLGTQGAWYKPGFVGSIDYVSINLPRLTWLARDEAHLLEMIRERMEVARKILNFLRKRHEWLYRMGLFPVTKTLFEAWVGDKVAASFMNPIRLYYYNTIAVIGLAEAADIWIRRNRGLRRSIWNYEDADIVRDIVNFYEKILTFINEVATEFEREDNVLYNIEQAPAESASVKLALRDAAELGREYREYIPRDVDPLSRREYFYYTSQLTPPYTTYSIKTQIYIEAICQSLFTGGVSKILQVHVPFVEPDMTEREIEDGLERLSRLIQEIMSYEPVEGRRIVYLAYTPVQNHCHRCSFVWVGDPYEHTDEQGRPRCPRCGSTEIDTWSRIVGYYRPIRSWNPGKRAEFMSRLAASRAQTW